MLFVTFWLAGAARMIGSPEPSIILFDAFWQAFHCQDWFLNNSWVECWVMAEIGKKKKKNCWFPVIYCMHSVYSVVHLPVIRCWETRTFSYLFIPVFFDTGVLCLLQHLEVAMKAEATAKLTCWCNLLWMTRLQVPTNQLTPLLPLFLHSAMEPR